MSEPADTPAKSHVDGRSHQHNHVAPIKPQYIKKLPPPKDASTLAAEAAAEAAAVAASEQAQADQKAARLAAKELRRKAFFERQAEVQKLVESGMSKEDAETKVPSLNNPNADKRPNEDINEIKNGVDAPVAKKQKRTRGQNKGRKRQKVGDNMCNAILQGKDCSYGDSCKFSHDLDEFARVKGSDIPGVCPFWERLGGRCRYGLGCRLANTHIPIDDVCKPVNLQIQPNGEPVRSTRDAIAAEERGWLNRDAQTALKRGKYKFPRSKSALLDIKKRFPDGLDKVDEDDMEQTESSNKPKETFISCEPDNTTTDVEAENSTVYDNPRKKHVDFRDKLILAPLTTVGNMPFRRVCKGFGVDITVGEMALATNLLRGNPAEWSLVRRHESEDIFGVQIAGGKAEVVAKCCELLQAEADIDYIDLNCGCPIDMIFKSGMGSALMRGKGSKFERVVRSMSHVMDIPLSIKLRTGIYQNSPNAHELIPKLKIWGANLVTIHGRSKEARYTKLADWAYIDKCSKLASPIPLCGNGDILSFEEAIAHKKDTGVASLMIGRGALIKPWIFTEIKEQRHWDISSGERLDVLRDFTKFGLEHWGSDTEGVEKTRRFLLEWCSFLYRYIPIGLLEVLPQKVNERPPQYFGRNDLETLMASPDSNDWVKLSEMLLGPMPANVTFVPKHKSNSYGPDKDAAGPEVQG